MHRSLLLGPALVAAVVGLSGCVGLTVAGIAANVVSSAIGGGGAPQTAEAVSPSRQIYEGLSQVDDRVSPSCSARLASLQAEAAQSSETDGPLLAEGPDRPNAWSHPEWAFAPTAGATSPGATSPGATSPGATPPHATSLGAENAEPGGADTAPPPAGAAAESSPYALSNPQPEADPARALPVNLARRDAVPGRRCSVQPTCLPGMQQPAPMMVCVDGDTPMPKAPSGQAVPSGGQSAAARAER